MSQKATRTARRAQNSLRNKAQKAMERTTKAASNTAHDAVRSVNKSVHRSPWAYIGGAALAGLLAGVSARFGAWSRR